MSMVVPKEGCKAVGDGFTDTLVVNVHLFSTNTAPTPASVYADYTAIEADFTGYASTNTTFTFSSFDGSNRAVYLGTVVTFTQTGILATNNIYGYFLGDGGKLLGVELFSAVIVMDATGKAISFQPMLTFKSEF